ncbi:MAG: alanine--tRNA ligase, partial [Alphaproteobacteria bacterium]|nr:alanine--tRNA ligase [Alphaproteobacteria bacterium]
FDISHPKPIEAEEIAWVEAEVNARIRQNAPGVTRLMSPEEADKQGAMALFGEKYGEEVRVVSMGEDAAATDRHGIYSVELCGGTHVRATGDIGLFKIVGEGAVSAGVRRIEALTGAGALGHVAARDAMLDRVAVALRAPAGEAPERIAALVEERRKLERDLAELRRKLATGASAGPASTPAFEDVGGVRLAARKLDGVPAKDLKDLADALKQQIGSGVVALVTVAEDGKASLVVGVTADLAKRCDAVALVRAGAGAIGGKGGGGRPEMAQAGGPDGAKAEAALEAVRAALRG